MFRESNKSETVTNRRGKIKVETASDHEDITELPPNKRTVTTRKRQIKFEVESDQDEDVSEIPSNKKPPTTRKRKIKIEDESDQEYVPEKPSNKKTSTTRTRKIKVKNQSEHEDAPEIPANKKTSSTRTGKMKVENEYEQEDVPEKPSNKKSSATRKRKIKVEKDESVSNHEDLPQLPANPKKIKTDEDNMQPECSKWAMNSNSTFLEPAWTEFELLSEYKNIDPIISQNITRLLDEGNTIPFIARYRRNVTGNMSPEMLRDIKECYEEVTHLKSRIKTVVTSVEKSGKLTESLNRTIVSAKTLEELEHIYAPFKPGSKRTLAERAKELGLEDSALMLLYNKQKVYLETLVDLNNKDLNSLVLVEKGIIHIIASLIATDTEVLSHVRKLRSQSNFTMETKKSNTKLDKTEAKDKKKVKKEVDESKYENYFDYQIPIKYIKPHQVLAINRGESQKILSVKVNVPDGLFKSFSYFCVGKFINRGPFDENRKRILNECIKDSYTRFIQPLIIREVRADLKVKAEKASYEVFCTNLKHLLLAPPLKGKAILGIDPGFSNGCKVALISKTGSLVTHTVIYPNIKKTRGEETLKSILLKHNCELVALGNGTACRETEKWLTDLIKSNYFAPLTISYTIVDEDGASIYSCSPEAKKEFPDLDPNIISAVSLARRIQEPLAELVKVEPQHLGVGMYQHDLKKKRLEEALNEVVSECVSFVGVDLNTTSQCLLRKIAGLSDKRATCIIEHREENGPFICRKQLLDVKGIGKKVFEQCAGFLRVGPIDANDAVNFYKNSNTTKLDCTYIHPESYEIALKVLKKLDMNPNDIGNWSFISTIKSMKPALDIESFSREIGCDEGTANLILDALSKPLNHDLRSELNKTPLFRKSLTSIADISVGTVLTGKVKNATHFGCFVDIGVGKDGLIHSRAMNGFNLQIGDRVEVEILNLDRIKQRIGLKTLRKL